MKKKENLVLVHSFPTNSILLSGLIHFLKDYFHVYPIDLPGFVAKNPPLKKITMQGFSDYLDSEIRKLKLDHYIVGGISFGYWVVSSAQLNRNCRGVLAIEPYTDWKCLRQERVTLLKRIFFISLIRVVNLLNLYKVVWKSKQWRKSYLSVSGYYAKRNKIILREIDPKTFATCARFILGNRKPVQVHDLPTVLLINPNDSTLDGKYVKEFFKQRTSKLLVMKTKIGHYPRKVTKKYFQKHIKKDDIEKMYSFLEGYSGKL